MISAQRMAETVHASVLAEISAERSRLASVPLPLPLLNGLPRSPAIVADGWVQDVAAKLHAARHHRAYDEAAIRAHAENYATICSRTHSLESRRSFGLHVGVLPPQGHGITREGETLRWDDCNWWRRQLRKVWTRASEDALRDIGIIRKGKQPYASDAAIEHREARQRRTREWMAERVMVNGEGEQLELLELQKHSVANPALRRGEFMTRMRGFEEIANDLKHVALFFTLTAPSAFHAHHAGGGVNQAWEVAERPRVRQAQQWLRTMWARARAKLARLSILFYGFRVAEPHHDATPHWHMVLFVPARNAGDLQAVLRGVWLSEFAHEPGAAEHRCKVVTIEAGKGSATGYVAKYVSKNIDGAGSIGEGISDETGAPVAQGVRRVAAWAALHGIRQFQQIGGPPVGLWRECRRVRELGADGDADIARVVAAADRGDWRAFIYAASSDHIRAGRKTSVRVARHRHDTHFAPVEREINSYNEPRAPRIFGVRCASAVVVTRPHVWRIERKCSSSVDGGAAGGQSASVVPDGRMETSLSWSDSARSGSEFFARSAILSDLGPVAITVRKPELEAAEIQRARNRMEDEIAGRQWRSSYAERQERPPRPDEVERIQGAAARLSTAQSNPGRFGRHVHKRKSGKDHGH